MYQYGQYCPVARAAEILADRWTMLIVRELLADVNHFNELERGLPHMSRTLLSERLRRLEQTGVLERRGASRGKRTEYRLTPAGRELQPIIDLFGEWGARWAFGAPRPNELDPIILLWWMRRRVAINRVPHRRVVIQFDFRGTPQRSYWLVIDRSDVSVCLKHPGFEVDVILTADIMTFYQVWLGGLVLTEAIRKGDVRLDGAPVDIRAFSTWFTWSPMAETVRAALRDRRTAPRNLNRRPRMKSSAARIAS
jgi:DNA-binding HxlR family transcriptional regulator